MESSWYLRLILGLACAPFFYYALCLVAGLRTLRALRRTPRSEDPAPPASILKPVRGADRGAYENFASFCNQDYPEYEVIFCVAEEDDPAVPVIRKLIMDFPERSIRLVIGQPHRGLNSKADKMIRLVQEARYDLLVSSDSDVRVGPDYLRTVAAPFRDPRVAAVTTLFRSEADGSFVSRIEALGLAGDFWASGLVACLFEGGLKWGTGATMAITRERLAEIGGYEAIADLHSEDFRLAQGVVSRGKRVEFAAQPIRMVLPVRTLRAYLEHQALWCLRLRRIRPKGHFGMLFTHGLPWSVLAAILAPNAEIAAGFLGTYLFLRLMVIWLVGVRILGDATARRSSWLIPFRDAISFGVWVASFFMKRVRWRGREFVIEPGGRLALPGSD